MLCKAAAALYCSAPPTSLRSLAAFCPLPGINTRHLPGALLTVFLNCPPACPPGGWLFPKKHIHYWMGLRWRNGNRWNYTDTTIPSPTFRTYSHWGSENSSQTQEPNSLRGAERCGVANYTQEFDGAWGWSDTMCNETYVQICRIMREWRCWCYGVRPQACSCCSVIGSSRQPQVPVQ